MIGAPAARLAALTATLEAVRLAPCSDDPRLDGTLARTARGLLSCAETLADPELARLGRQLAAGTRASRGVSLDAVLAHLATVDRGMSAQAPPRRVLVIDGDAGMRRLHDLTLSSPDVTVIPAASLAEALAILERVAVDLTVLELSLPDGDGRMLLGAGRPEAGAMVVCTGEQDLLSRTECYALGAEAVLVKPCAPEELQACVSGRLSRLGMSAYPRREEAAWWTGSDTRTRFADGRDA